MRTPTPTNVLHTSLESGTDTSTERKVKQAKFNLRGMYAKSMRRRDAKQMKNDDDSEGPQNPGRPKGNSRMK